MPSKRIVAGTVRDGRWEYDRTYAERAEPESEAEPECCSECAEEAEVDAALDQQTDWSLADPRYPHVQWRKL